MSRSRPSIRTVCLCWILLLLTTCCNTVFAQLPPTNVTTNATTPTPSNATALPPNATDLPPTTSSGDDVPMCTKPFVDDPLYATGGQSNPESCQLGCCIPCPQHYIYYPEDALTNGFRVTTALRTVSAIATFILIVSYLVLPNKRNHPALLILFSALAIFIVSSSAFFSISEPKKIQCADKFNQANQDNNPLCLVQGTLNVFGSHATAAWLAVLILNMHLHTVWNSQVLQRKYVFLHLICWGFPFALTTVTLAKGAIRYEFGETCTIGHEHADTLFFFPIFVLVIPAFLIHLCTFFYIGKVSIRARRTNFDKRNRRSSVGGMFLAIKVQWRALALAVSLITTVIVFSIFYFQIVVLTKDASKNPRKFGAWSRCILEGLGQTACSQYAADLMPSPGTMFAAESAISAMGIIFFFLFVAQKQFFLDWKNLIAGLRRRKEIKYLDKLEQKEMEERFWEERRHKREHSQPEDGQQPHGQQDKFALYRASGDAEPKEFSYY